MNSAAATDIRNWLKKKSCGRTRLVEFQSIQPPTLISAIEIRIIHSTRSRANSSALSVVPSTMPTRITP